MRRVLLAIGLLAATGLAGCDRWDALWNKPAPQPVAVTCQCAPPIRGTVAPASAAAAESHASVHRRAAHGYRYGHRYAGRSEDIYNYSSPSRGSYGGASGYGEEGYGYRSRQEGTGERARAWEDGYGRRHLYDAGEASYYEEQSHARVAQTPERLDPWHGYDDDWD